MLDERKVRAVELRFFLGCTNEEAADPARKSRAPSFTAICVFQELAVPPAHPRHPQPRKKR